jgi:hypothetical protein
LSHPKTASFRAATARTSTNSISQKIFCFRKKLGGLKFLSIRFYNSCRRLPETKRHSSLQKFKKGTNAMKCCICVTFLYAVVTWTFRKIGQKYLESFWLFLEKDGDNPLD